MSSMRPAASSCREERVEPSISEVSSPICTSSIVGSTTTRTGAVV